MASVHAANFLPCALYINGVFYSSYSKEVSGLKKDGNNSITLKKQVDGILSQIVNIKIFDIEATCQIERNNQGD